MAMRIYTDSAILHYQGGNDADTLRDEDETATIGTSLINYTVLAAIICMDCWALSSRIPRYLQYYITLHYITLHYSTLHYITLHDMT